MEKIGNLRIDGDVTRRPPARRIGLEVSQEAPAGEEEYDAEPFRDLIESDRIAAVVKESREMEADRSELERRLAAALVATGRASPGTADFAGGLRSQLARLRKQGNPRTVLPAARR